MLEQGLCIPLSVPQRQGWATLADLGALHCIGVAIYIGCAGRANGAFGFALSLPPSKSFSQFFVLVSSSSMAPVTRGSLERRAEQDTTNTALKWTAVALGIVGGLLLIAIAAYYIRRLVKRRKAEKHAQEKKASTGWAYVYPKRKSDVERGDEDGEGEQEVFLQAAPSHKREPSDKDEEAGFTIYPSSSLRTNASSASPTRQPHYLKQQHAEIEKMYAAREEDGDTENAMLEPPPTYVARASSSSRESHDHPQLAVDTHQFAPPPSMPFTRAGASKSSTLDSESVYSPSIYSLASAAPSLSMLPNSTTQYPFSSPTAALSSTQLHAQSNELSSLPESRPMSALPDLPDRRSSFARYAYEDPIQEALRKAAEELERDNEGSLHRVDTQKVAGLLKGRAKGKRRQRSEEDAGADNGLERTVSRIERDNSIRSYHTKKSVKIARPRGGRHQSSKDLTSSIPPIPAPPSHPVALVPNRRLQELKIVTDPAEMKNAKS